MFAQVTEQMIKRIGAPPEGIVYPVWVWYQWEGRREAARYENAWKKVWRERNTDYFAYHRCTGKTCLLLDFDYWHFVLNNIPLKFSEDGRIERCSETEKLKS